MRRASTVALCALCVSSAAAAIAESQRISIKVVEIAGGHAYLEPGGDAGLRSGTKVVIGKKTFTVVAVTATNAVIRLDQNGVHVGSSGRATVTTTTTEVRKLSKPAALDSFRGVWQDASLPADEQNPEPIPIGVIRRGGPTEVRVGVDSASWLPLRDTPSDPVTRVSLRTQLRTEPFADVPFGLDADVLLSRWFGVDDLGNDSRPLFEVQELRARYGSAAAPLVGLGRLRYAAYTVGLLDGVRVASPSYSGVSVAAFGGVVPNTLDGALSTDLTRFGAEVAYDAPKHAWRPGGELVLYGSTFDGSVDERRVAGNFRAYPGPVSLYGHTELSMFDADNPWGARRVELTAAGLDANLRVGPFELGASIDAQQPERSRWLASLLPASWLCTATPQPLTDPPTPEPCDGSRNLRYYGTARAGLRFSKLAVQAGGTTIRTPAGSDQLGGYFDVQTLRLWQALSLSLGGLVATSPVLDTLAGRIGAAFALTPSLDLDLYYRPAVLRFEAATDDIFEHRAGVGAYYAIGTDLALRLSGESMYSDDVTAVGVFGAATWRLGF